MLFCQIYEGQDETGTLMHSGESKPVDITAESGHLFIQFNTDAAPNAVGFYAEYSKGKHFQSVQVGVTSSTIYKVFQ